MPNIGTSTEWIEVREDEIAEFITAREHLNAIRTLTVLLHERKMINRDYYEDAQDSIDFIGSALLTGKRNTALLRNYTGVNRDGDFIRS